MTGTFSRLMASTIASASGSCSGPQNRRTQPLSVKNMFPFWGVEKPHRSFVVVEDSLKTHCLVDGKRKPKTPQKLLFVPVGDAHAENPHVAPQPQQDFPAPLIA